MESKELVVARGLGRSIYVTPKGVGLVVWWGFHLGLIENALWEQGFGGYREWRV